MMNLSIFLSHNWEDKSFARKLARDLEAHGVKVWIDEAEIKIGDSLIEKICEGLDNVDYVAVVLTPNSVASAWVKRELDVAMNHEISGKQVKVLPIMYKHCDLPGFMLGKLYADFTHDELYEYSFEVLTRTLGVVFNRRVLYEIAGEPNFSDAVDRAVQYNLPIMCVPFHRPFQYIGLPANEVVKTVKGIQNEVGNIFVEDPNCKMVMTVEGNFISFVEVDIKKTQPCDQSCDFDSVALLGCLSVNSSELEFVRNNNGFHTYYDHRRRLKVTVSCLYDGAPLSVSFGAKYYGM